MKENVSFAELAKMRQSDRKYKNQPVEKEKLIQCLETARISPSANNSQPWKFIVVDDFEKKEQIAECSIGLGMNKFTHQCPVIVAVVLEKQNFIFCNCQTRKVVNHQDCPDTAINPNVGRLAEINGVSAVKQQQ